MLPTRCFPLGGGGCASSPKRRVWGMPPCSHTVILKGRIHAPFRIRKNRFLAILPIPSVFHPDPLQFHEPTHAVHGWQEHDDLAG